MPRQTCSEYAMDALGFSEDDCKRIQDGRQGEVVPLVFGDWEKDEWNRYLVEAFLVDVSARKLIMGATMSGYSLDSVVSSVQILKPDGSTATKGLTNIDLSKGTAIISDYTYSDGDRFFCRLKGLKPAITDGRLVENPVDVAVALLGYAGIAMDKMDTGSRLTARWLLKKRRVRRVLKERCELGEVLSRLGFETGFRVRSSGGVVQFVVPDWLAFDQDWQRFGKDELISFERFATDPDGLAAGKWIAKTLYNPREDGYELVIEAGESGRFGYAEDREVEFNWVCARKDVLHRLMTVEFLFGRHQPKIFEFRLSHAAMELTPLTGFWLDMPWLFGEPQPFLALETRRDVKNGVVDIKALWLGYVFDIGRWTSDDHPDWSNSTDQQRRFWGYWTDEDGLCNPADPESNMSNWGM
ncbi:MAG TPA: hypothetical protein ENF73_00070 [Proteobacteria bacterium]|nr:hypothetical protein [Pseudomonadota bacterium]